MVNYPPLPALLHISDIAENLEGVLVSAKNDLTPHMGKFESPVEASLMLNLVIRCLDAIIELARKDMVLLPSALVLARSSFEIGLKARWLINPTDVFERESRWLAHIAEEEKMLDRLAALSRDTGEEVRRFSESGEIIREFRQGVEALLPNGTKVTKAVPNLREIARELKVERLYLFYIILSQNVHGSHFAGQTYRRGMGNSKQFGEFISPNLWAQSFRIAIWSLTLGVQRLVEIVEVPDVSLNVSNKWKEFEAALHVLEQLGEVK